MKKSHPDFFQAEARLGIEIQIARKETRETYRPKRLQEHLADKGGGLIQASFITQIGETSTALVKSGKGWILSE